MIGFRLFVVLVFLGFGVVLVVVLFVVVVVGFW